MKKSIKLLKLIFIPALMALVLTFAACGEEPPALLEGQGSAQLPEDSGTASASGGFPFAFSAYDLYENSVTEASLGEKEIYFVHYWGTWCPPCVEEMPDIAEVAKQYSDRVGFIGLLDDYSSNRQGAINIKESAGVDFITVDAAAQGLENVLAMLQTGYVPTTVILDRNGDIIGEAIIGAYGAEYARFLDAALD